MESGAVPRLAGRPVSGRTDGPSVHPWHQNSVDSPRNRHALARKSWNTEVFLSSR
jgi:hypothetical protein